MPLSRTLRLSTFLACTVLFSAGAYAEPPKNTVKPSTPAASVSKGPTLTDEQRDKFRELVRDVMDNMKDARELHEQLADLAQSPGYSDKQARQVIQKHQKQTEENLVKSTRALNDFYKGLSPEQRKQVDALHDQMKERRREEARERAKERRQDK